MDLDALRHKTLLLGLSEAHLQAVAGIARTRSYRQGEVVARRGELGDAVYIVERGSVELRRVERGKERAVAIFEKGSWVDDGYSGDFFGEFALVDLEPWAGTAVARDRAVLLEIKRDDLNELFSRDIDFQIAIIFNMARVLCRRLRIKNRRLALASLREES